MACVLVIDDDDRFRGLLRETLTEAGHDVLAASDGSDGVELFAQNQVDLIVTDIIMAEKEGFETIYELRRDHPSLPIIAISGGGHHASGDSYLRTAEALGADRSLQKPFPLQRLLDMVGELLNRPT